MIQNDLARYPISSIRKSREVPKFQNEFCKRFPKALSSIECLLFHHPSPNMLRRIELKSVKWLKLKFMAYQYLPPLINKIKNARLKTLALPFQIGQKLLNKALASQNLFQLILPACMKGDLESNKLAIQHMRNLRYLTMLFRDHRNFKYLNDDNANERLNTPLKLNIPYNRISKLVLDPSQFNEDLVRLLKNCSPKTTLELHCFYIGNFQVTSQARSIKLIGDKLIQILDKNLEDRIRGINIPFEINDEFWEILLKFSKMRYLVVDISKISSNKLRAGASKSFLTDLILTNSKVRENYEKYPRIEKSLELAAQYPNLDLFCIEGESSSSLTKKLEKLSQNCANIKHLQFHNDIKLKGCLTIIGSLLSLKSLIIKKNSLENEELNQFASQLKIQEFLEFLYLTDCPNVSQLNFLEKMKALRLLHLHSCNVPEKEVKKMVRPSISLSYYSVNNRLTIAQEQLSYYKAYPQVFVISNSNNQSTHPTEKSQNQLSYEALHPRAWHRLGQSKSSACIRYKEY
jgi:hypothetical protein